MMNVLVVGNGGREHALGWKLCQSPRVKNLFFAPGNGGTAELGTNLRSNPHDKHRLYQEIRVHRIGLVVVAQDEYLAAGLVDYLMVRGIAAFGPTKAAAKLEWSKSFAKRFMIKEGVPTARFKICTSYKTAFAYSRAQKYPLVIKADGLAYGKGVVIAKSIREARAALKQIFRYKAFGRAESKVVIEEYLQGKEITVHAFCDGKNAILFPASQDHKRACSGDRGPNTGGVGSIAPVPWVTKGQMAEIRRTVIEPVMRGMRRRGTPFSGVLYPGIMMTVDGPKVIEFNARFGDPEAQSYMHLLDSDLAEILLACVRGSLKKISIRWKSLYEACVVLASGGYPGLYKTGYTITLPSQGRGKGVVVFYAGVARQGKDLVTSGGRVLGVSATGRTLPQAIKKAYTAIKGIHFTRMQYRKDIGQKYLSQD